MKSVRDDWRRALFARVVSGDDASISLALASLVFAMDRYPDLDVSAHMATLNALADGARRTVSAELGGATALARLASYLHGEQGFDGSMDAYATTHGCFLNHTLQTRTGLPITLSVVYLEVGWRLGLPLHGVGLPGHFIIKYGDDADEAYCDPFHAGRLLTAEECEQLMRQQNGYLLQFRSGYLAAVGRRGILYRIINNLKRMYVATHRLELALWAMDRMVILRPDSMFAVLDRGELNYAVGRFTRANSDFLSSLMMDPNPLDVKRVMEFLPEARRRAGLDN